MMKRGLRIFLIWTPIFFIGFIVYAVCLGRINIQDNLKVSQKWFPSYSHILFKQNEKYLIQKLDVSQAEKIKMNAFRSLRRVPLSHFPFAHLGEVNLFSNRPIKARKLFSEALSRDVRDLRALRGILYLNLAERKTSEAIQNLDVLLKLRRSSSSVEEYQAILLLLVLDEQAVHEIDNYLTSRPIWGRKFLFNRIGKMTDNNYQTIGQSITKFESSVAKQQRDNILHEYYMQTLRKLGKIDTALDYWQELHGGAELANNYTVFNPTFEKKKELPPFNWSEIDKRKYFSEIDQEGGVYASYADSVVRVLAEQILRLEPGRDYELNVNAEWSYKRRQGNFTWQVVCLETSDTISQINMDETSKKNLGGIINFRVPDECDFQIVKLVAKPGQYSQRIWSRTKSVNITALN